MQLENLNLDSQEKSGEIIDKTEAKTRLQEVADIQKALGKMHSSKYPDIEAKLKNKPQLQKDIWDFIEKAANGNLNSSLGKLQASEFDKDGNEGLSKFEFEKFLQSADTTIQQIILLGSSSELSRIYHESGNPSWYEIDKKIANTLDLQKLVLGEKGGSSFMEDLLQRSGGLDESEREKIGNQLFSLTSTESYKNLGIFVAKDIGDGLESIMRFLLNMPAGVTLLPRYLNYRYERNFGTQEKVTEADIKIKELAGSNPSLEILELLGEKGVEVLKSLYESMKSGKIKDISMILTSIAGLIAGGAGLVKLGAKGVGKVSSGKISNFAGKIESGAGKVADTSGRVDKALSTAGGSELFGGAKAGGINSKTESLEKRIFSSQQMLDNSQLDDISRIAKAEEYLGVKLTDTQKNALLEAHNYGAEGELAYSQGEKNVKGLKLIKGGFKRDQAQMLLDSALAGTPDKIVAGLKEIKGFESLGKKSPEIEAGLKQLLGSIGTENIGKNLADLSTDYDTFLKTLMKYGNDIGTEFKYTPQLETSLKELEIFLRSKNLPTTKLGQFISDFHETAEISDNTSFAFLADGLYESLYALNKDKPKLEALKGTGTLIGNVEVTSSLKKYGFEIKGFPENLFPKEIADAFGELAQIIETRGSNLSLGDIPDDLLSKLANYKGTQIMKTVSEYITHNSGSRVSQILEVGSFSTVYENIFTILKQVGGDTEELNSAVSKGLGTFFNDFSALSEKVLEKKSKLQEASSPIPAIKTESAPTRIASGIRPLSTVESVTHTKIPQKIIEEIPTTGGNIRNLQEAIQTLKGTEDGGLSSEMIRNLEKLSSGKFLLDFGESGIFFVEGGKLKLTTWKKLSSQEISLDNLQSSGYERITNSSMPNSRQESNLYYNVLFNQKLGYR